MIEAKGLSKTVETASGQIEILQAIDLKINAGETIAILGASGSGKTTLLGLLAGLDTPTQGSVHINDKNITDMNEEQRAQLRAEKIGFVFQSFQLIPAFNAIENTSLPLDLAGKKIDEEHVISLLKQVDLGHRLDHTPRQLSGGEQQRVAIARAFVTQPEYLFADEPTGNLDKKTGQKVMDLLFELNEQQQSTLILVTHDEHLANRCQRQLVLDEGRWVQP
ncbi:MAG: ATP-binding cassette domain-containing protein [Methylococcales bacterium]|jgi:putative ABC transport system ATP-binding protein|nr:ATP-binding cassette domain-containing protein [Methylococcales bacterium]MBT7444837.1 ATP-binding cassette domain-containing protein [Methylococcales bacterium]